MHLGNIAAYDRNCFFAGEFTNIPVPLQVPEASEAQDENKWGFIGDRGELLVCRDWSREWSISAIIGTIGPKNQF